mmetsp:Transcript_19893/g.41555  ORF Transcript_19893/g.41555 Transcript_19893/m.41555 type:complete len:717 (+) Transcript_19893:1-2151(+)
MKFTLSIAAIGGAVASASRPIDQVEHIIIFMQENRAFDHYFGTLNGVRGFNDRVGVPMENGFDSFHQPTNTSDLTEYMLPFRADTDRTNAMCMPAPEMYYPTDIKMFNEGRMDAWNTARDPGLGMSYFTREDLPFYYELYDHFAVGDAYYQSTFTCTCPNRLHLFAGSNGLSVGQEASMENNEPTPGFDWVTMGEQLEEAGISWRNYQQEDNFDDNGFAWFDTYMNAQEGDALYDKGMKRELDAILAFERDVKADSLPQVSWIIAPAEKSEHATYHPSAGEDWTARILKALQSNPDVYAKSVFILNYDEGGQFYDHAWTPTPPMSEDEGISTVTTDGELNMDANNLYSFDSVPQPIGMGFRVPLLVISPWSRGNIVVSEVMDHVSTIKFVEERFNISNPNISPWRRAMAGNMMSAFDFEGEPDFSWPDLPDTSDYVKKGDEDCAKGDITVPTEQSMPTQETGVRVSRALPYEFVVSDSGADFSAGFFKFTVANTGAAGAPFVTFNTLDIKGTSPRPHAIEAGKSIEDVAKISDSGEYDFYFSGPNGFTRLFGGDKTDLPITTSMTYDVENSNVVINVDLTNAKQDVTFNLEDLGEYGVFDKNNKVTFTVKGGEKGSQKVFVGDASVGNWYDLKLSIDDSAYYRRFLGRMETGKDTISDPAMDRGVKGLWNKAEVHPPVPERMRKVPRPTGEEFVGLQVGAKAPIDKDGRYDASYEL